MACTNPLAVDVVGLDLAREYCMGRPRDSACHGLVIPCLLAESRALAWPNQRSTQSRAFYWLGRMAFTRIRQSHRTQELIQIGSRAHNIVTAAEREGSAHTCNKHLATLHALAFFTCHLTNIMIVVCVCV
jgi:hypothetical protein